jgi:mono/diheme cytochrome c family protein/glucose/arabinose dehydrogenase
MVRLSRFRAIAFFAAAAAASVSAFQSPRASSNLASPTGLPSAPGASPVLSPDEEMKTFRLPPGYRVELVASEPMVQEPILIDWDQDGRLWVIELLGYMQDLPASTEREASGRVSVLEDLNGDGKMDKKTVFLDGLVLPRALKVLDRGVLVAEPPNLWFARDTNGDLRADTKEAVMTSYGRLEANVEHNANGLVWALDNWMHTSETDVFLRLKNGTFESQRTLARGQWGGSQDDAGRIYRNSNESVLHVDLVPTPYYARNPNLVRTRGSYESLRGDNNEVMRVWPAHPTPGVNRAYQAGVLREDGTMAAYTAVAAPTVYRGDRLPADLSGNIFVVEPAANLVSRIIVSDDGTTVRARKAYEGSEFLTSTDERFRPVYLSSAPDGTLYVVDMYRGIIQHRAYITEYLRDQIVSRQLDAPPRHGRIYRIVHETTRRDRAPALSRAPSAKLVELLSHPNGWWRDTAQRLLVERGDRSVTTGLRKRVEGAPSWRTRLRALWTLDGLDSVQPDLVVRALDDRARDVRVAAIRLSEQWLRQPGHPLLAVVLKRFDDPDWAVRRQLAASLGALPAGSREAELARMLERRGDDPVIVDASLSGLNGSEATVLDKLLVNSVQTPSLDSAITMLTATIVRGAQGPIVQKVLELVTEDGRPMWQRSAILRGAEAVLLGAALPGGSGRGIGSGRAGNPPPTASAQRGARGGPGGTPAFPRAGRGGRNQGSVTALRLPAEPTLVSFAARGNGDLGKRATALLARLTWPGKPDAAPAAAPLTADEQKRFDAGREIYQSLCSACHQPDGRGQEKLAPSLVGSEFALGAGDVAIRIVLNGKEGATGLMPPLGSVLTDEQIAAALTYIRREWGHTAPAVEAGTVKQVRTLTAGRTRPWTADELSQLPNAK